MKQLLNTLLLLLVVFGRDKLYGQKPGQVCIDSILKELPHQKEDTNKAKLLIRLSYFYSHINTDEGIKYGLLAVDIAGKIGWQKGVAMAENNLGINYDNRSDYLKAMTYYLDALKIEEVIGYKNGIANVSQNIGIIYMNKGDYGKALEYYLKSLKAFKELNDKKGCKGME